MNKFQPRMNLTRTITVIASHAKFHPGAGRRLFQRSFITVSRTFFSFQLSNTRPHTSRITQRPQSRTYSIQNTPEDLESTSFPDPTRPDVFYHLVQTSKGALPTRAFAVSFLPTPPPSPESSTVIGWLPVEEGTGLNDFRENRTS